MRKPPRLPWLLVLLLLGCNLINTPVKPMPTQALPTGGPERVLTTDVFSLTCPAGWLTHEELFGKSTSSGHDPILDADELFQMNNAQSNAFGDKYTASCGVWVKTTEGQTLSERVTASYKFLRDNDYPIISQTDVIFAGAPGIEVINKRPNGEPWYQFRDLWTEHAGKVYVLSCQINPGDFDTALPLFKQIAESFTFN